jgi:RNA polymerase sigma factor (sigma-70 family)
VPWEEGGERGYLETERLDAVWADLHLTLEGLDEFVAELAEAGVDRAFALQLLREVLDALIAREREILVLRFGLTDDCPHTLDDVGQHLGVTRERIRQIEAKTLKKLSSCRQCHALRESLE